MCNKNLNTLDSVQFAISKQTVSMDVIRETINKKLAELGFESNFNNINSDWHVYKAYNSDVLVTDNVIEFFDYIEADINLYDRGDEYVVEVKRYGGNISEVELYVTLRQAFLEGSHVDGGKTMFSKHFAYLKHVLLSILAFLFLFI